MTVDFTQYQAPGVYVEDTTTPLVNPGGVNASFVTIIGPSIGYQTATEVQTLVYLSGSGVPVALDQTGAWLSSASGGVSHHNASIAPPVVTNISTNTLLLEGTDYSLTLTTPTHADIGGSVTTITALRSGLNGIPVSIVYNYTNDAYITPQQFTNFDDLVDVYGPPLTSVAPASPTANQVISPLSLAAQIAFQNGATQVIAVALDPAAGTLAAAFVEAYAMVTTSFNVGIIVPLFLEATPTSATTSLSNVEALAQGLVTAVENASNEGFPRVGIYGVAQGLLNSGGSALAGQADYTTLAAATHDSRVMLAYPNALSLYNGNLNQTTTVDGAYLAAAYAGILSANAVNQGLTRQSINGFNGIPASLQQLQTKTFKDALSSTGVAVTELNRQNVLVCRHGVTTDMTSVLTREVSITRQSDALYYLIYDGIDASGLIGSPILIDTVLSVVGIITGILENAVANGVIVDYQTPSVRQQALPSGDPTAIQVKFAWLPALPLNYVIVSFSIDLNTGDYSDLSTDAVTTSSTSGS